MMPKLGGEPAEPGPDLTTCGRVSYHVGVLQTARPATRAPVGLVPGRAPSSPPTQPGRRGGVGFARRHERLHQGRRSSADASATDGARADDVVTTVTTAAPTTTTTAGPTTTTTTAPPVPPAPAPVTGVPAKPVASGTSGPAVQQLQQRLVEMGYWLPASTASTRRPPRTR